jgi:hypothetical protein
MLRSWIVTATLVACIPSIGFAQRPQLSATLRDADSAAAYVVTMAVMTGLGAPLSLVVLAPTETPWRISVPDSTASIWRRVRQGLETLLRARPVRSADSSFRFLEIVLYPMRGDTLDFYFTVGERWRCSPTGWLEASYTYLARTQRVAHSANAWEQPRILETRHAGPGFCSGLE